MTSEALKAYFVAYAASPSMVERSLEQQREVMETLPAFGSPPDGVEVTPIRLGGRPGELAIADAGAAAGTGILYVHGGGFVAGSVASHRPLVAHLARATGLPVASVDYRLAPEHPFPAAFEDVRAACRSARSVLGFERLVLAGDSAGAALAVAAAVAGSGTGEPPAALVLLSPWLDLVPGARPTPTDTGLDPVVDEPSLRQMADRYLADHDPGDPSASPLRGDLSTLPPTLVQIGEGELLVDDARRLAAAAPDVELTTWPGAFHVFQACAGQVPEADEAVAAIGAWLRTRLGTPHPPAPQQASRPEESAP